MLQYRVQTSAKVTPHGPNSFGKHKETVGKAFRSPDVENLDITKFMFRKISFPIFFKIQVFGHPENPFSRIPILANTHSLSSKSFWAENPIPSVFRNSFSEVRKSRILWEANLDFYEQNQTPRTQNKQTPAWQAYVRRQNKQFRQVRAFFERLFLKNTDLQFYADVAQMCSKCCFSSCFGSPGGW